MKKKEEKKIRYATSQKYHVAKTLSYKDMLTIGSQSPAVHKQQNLQNLINQYQDNINKTTLKLLSNKFQCYQNIKEDGNSFIRAVAFQYLVTKDQLAFKQLFPDINTISLTKIKSKTIPQKFRDFYDDSKLKKFLKRCWQEQFQMFLQKYKEFRIALFHMLNKLSLLDFVIIVYFRSLCLKFCEDHSQQYKDLLINDQQQSIKSYGEQSQGLLILFMSKVLNINIIMIIINNNQQFRTEEYKQQKSRKNIFLLRIDWRYRILCKMKQSIQQLINKKDEKQIVHEDKKIKKQKSKVEIRCIQQKQCKICLNFDDKQCINCFIKNNGLIKKIIQENKPLKWLKQSNNLI